ncbi:MAG: hypothetical protein CL521_00740 [Actinobacteria bacterium]|nr:hypothetical protein [Actinomycetota bacterium]
MSRWSSRKESEVAEGKSLFISGVRSNVGQTIVLLSEVPANKPFEGRYAVHLIDSYVLKERW